MTREYHVFGNAHLGLFDLEDEDTRTPKRVASDNAKANDPEDAYYAVRDFFVKDEYISAELKRLIRQSYAGNMALCETFMSMTDDWAPMEILTPPLNGSSYLSAYKSPKTYESKQWMNAYGGLVSHPSSLEISGKLFVFSGLGGSSATEKEDPIVKKVMKKGGQYRASISGKTDHLVVEPAYAGSSKTKAVIDQRNKGHHIDVILAQDLAAILSGIPKAPKKPKEDTAVKTAPAPTREPKADKKTAEPKQAPSAANDDPVSNNEVRVNTGRRSWSKGIRIKTREEMTYGHLLLQ